jgi:hypothetical protein
MICQFDNITRSKPRDVSHSGLAIYIKKKYLKAKEEELWKLKYFTIAKIYQSSKKSSKKKPHKIIQDIIISLL